MPALTTCLVRKMATGNGRGQCYSSLHPAYQLFLEHQREGVTDISSSGSSSFGRPFHQSRSASSPDHSAKLGQILDLLESLKDGIASLKTEVSLSCTFMAVH